MDTEVTQEERGRLRNPQHVSPPEVGIAHAGCGLDPLSQKRGPARVSDRVAIHDRLLKLCHHRRLGQRGLPLIPRPVHPGGFLRLWHPPRSPSELRERFARPPQSNPEGENQRRVRNANSWVNKGEKGKGKSNTPEEREGERDRYRRWGRDNW